MNWWIVTLAAAALPWAVGGAQVIEFPASFERLAEKAEEVVDVKLDANVLGLAGAFMSEDDAEEKEAKEIIKGLKGIYIRGFEFSEEGQYTEADVEAVRNQLKAPEWTSVVTVRSRKKGASGAEVFVRKEDGRFAGLTILATEPKQFTVVHLIGSISPEQLSKIGGQLGIPKVETGKAGGKK
jgi:hypothetical protein